MARQRVEVQHPGLIEEVLSAAGKHGASVFGVHPKSVVAALERHYAGSLREDLEEANGRLAISLVQASVLKDDLAEARRNLEAGRPLYAVQSVQSLAAVNAALRDGSSIAELQGQVVIVRPLQVYDEGTATVQASTVVAEGACVCTAVGLGNAGLPVPQSVGAPLELLSQFVRHAKQGAIRFTSGASHDDREQFDKLVHAAKALLAGGE